MNTAKTEVNKESVRVPNTHTTKNTGMDAIYDAQTHTHTGSNKKGEEVIQKRQ